MQRVNERCLEFEPRDAGVSVVPAGETVYSGVYDVRGMKVLTMWVKTSEDIELDTEYLGPDQKEVLQDVPAVEMKGQELYHRIQFGTYANTPLPGFFIRFKLTNGGAIDSKVKIIGLGQLQ